MAKLQPRRDPHPAEDGTPWHLRGDLTLAEVRALTPEEKLERGRAAGRKKMARYRAEDPQKFRERARKHNLNRDPRLRKAEWLKNKYGIPAEVYDYHIAYQANLCAICGQPETTKRAQCLAVDHDHDTGIVRGFLCSLCNRSLGNMRDNPALLRAAADYLDHHNEHARYSAQIAKRLQIPTNI
jgi:hypothetical protein